MCISCAKDFPKAMENSAKGSEVSLEGEQGGQLAEVRGILAKVLSLSIMKGDALVDLRKMANKERDGDKDILLAELLYEPELRSSSRLLHSMSNVYAEMQALRSLGGDSSPLLEDYSSFYDFAGAVLESGSFCMEIEP